MIAATTACLSHAVAQQRQLLVGMLIGALISLFVAPLIHERSPDLVPSLRSSDHLFELQTMHNITVLAPRLSGRRPADWDSYQDFILNDTAAFRPKADQSHYMPEGFFERWQELRAQGDEMGERIFLPINWFECHYTCAPEAVKRLVNYLPSLDRRWKYFTLIAIDKGIAYWLTYVPADLDLLVFSSDGATRNARDIRLPLMTSVLQPKGLEKNITVSAAFSVGTHKIRPRVMETWAEWLNEPGFVQMEFSSREQYAELLERSVFTLAPRGIGPTSYRLTEAIQRQDRDHCSAADALGQMLDVDAHMPVQVGTIPIYIWEYDLVLPYQDIISWMDISIVVHPDDLRELRGKIDAFNVTRAQEILPTIRHMFDYPFIYSYILRRLQTEVLCPVPVSAFADDGAYHER